MALSSSIKLPFSSFSSSIIYVKPLLLAPATISFLLVTCSPTYSFPMISLPFCSSRTLAISRYFLSPSTIYSILSIVLRHLPLYFLSSPPVIYLSSLFSQSTPDSNLIQNWRNFFHPLLPVMKLLTSIDG